jgi:hypothetical protein
VDGVPAAAPPTSPTGTPRPTQHAARSRRADAHRARSVDNELPIAMAHHYSAVTGVPVVEVPRTDHFSLIDPESPGWITLLPLLERISRVDEG